MVCGQLYRWYLNPLVLQRPFEAGSKAKLFEFIKERACKAPAVDEGCISPFKVFHRQLLLNGDGNQCNSPPVFSFSLQCLSYACSLGPEMHLEGKDEDEGCIQLIPRHL